MDLKPRAPARPVWQPALLVLVLGLAGLVWATPAHAQYKWKDAKGQTHVSDMPPPNDVPERNILQRPASRRAPAKALPEVASGVGSGGSNGGSGSSVSSPVSPMASKPGTDPELDKRRQKLEQEARQKAQADEQRQAAQRADNCQRARQQLAMYQSGQRLVRPNAAGERIVVDDATRAAEQQLAQRVIDSDCR